MQYSQVDFDDDDDEDSSQGDASNNRASITDDDSSDEIDLENELEGSDWEYTGYRNQFYDLFCHYW